MAIKFCIWDVGQVIYPYSLRPLDEWVGKNTADAALWQAKGGVKSFDYNPYMSGEMNHEEFSRRLCESFGIEFSDRRPPEINKALHAGVGKPFAATIDTMEMLAVRGVENGILSNALPVLADTKPEIVKDEYAFTSFELGLLKPDPRIFAAVREKLGCRFGEMIFVDDKPRNVQAASDLGIYGIVYDPKTIKSNCMRALSGQKQYPAPYLGEKKGNTL